MGVLAVVAAWAFAFRAHHQELNAAGEAGKTGAIELPKNRTITFARDVAPILFQRCAPCHHPGQSAPFDLLTYADAKKHAKQIAEVTRSRYMPPWLPEHGYGEFAHERRLSDGEIEMLSAWFEQGAAEGNMAELPSAPEWDEGWLMGTPDLVVDLPAYSLAPEGKDVYRNLVASIPVDRTRFVRGVEFQPGNARVVHHAFINVDETGQSRRLAAKQDPPGIDGMEIPDSAVMPGGQLLGWQPGKQPSLAPDGLAWVLKPGTDVVLQMHMNPSGKKEWVQPRIGFYFTDQQPRNSAFRIKIAALKLDIPADEPRYVAEESYTLPVDLSLMRVGAHAHYLGKEIQAFAVLPGGEKKWLLWIKDWNFQWQGDYEYARPVELPRGTKIVSRFTYDNSTNNIRNPNSPPKRVRYGLQSSDEMGELYFQAVPRDPQDYRALVRDHSSYLVKVSEAFFEHRLRLDPADAAAHGRLGRIRAAEGRMPEALQHLQEAVRLDPNLADAQLDLGLVWLRLKRLPEAEAAFRAVVRLRPEESQAYGSLGIIALQSGNPQDAARYFEEALRVNPDDALAAKYLQELRRSK